MFMRTDRTKAYVKWKHLSVCLYVCLYMCLQISFLPVTISLHKVHCSNFALPVIPDDPIKGVHGVPETYL